MESSNSFRAEFAEPAVDCICRWSGTRSELIVGFSVEETHSRNHRRRSPDDSVHETHYEKCPKCGRGWFADNTPIFRGKR